MENTIVEKEIQTRHLKGTCPFCLIEIEVCMDANGHYWLCSPCGTRTSITEEGLHLLEVTGWVR